MSDTERLRPIVLGPGEGRAYAMGAMSAVFKADEAETAAIGMTRQALADMGSVKSNSTLINAAARTIPAPPGAPAAAR